MERKKLLFTYLVGALGQIFLVCIGVWILRNNGIQIDYTSWQGMLAIAAGGSASALWGIIVSIKFRNDSVKKIIVQFFNVKKNYKCYALVSLYLLLNFGGAFFGGKLQIMYWYTPILLFFSALLFGGIEEIGWRYTFQPVLEEKLNFVISTIITAFCWGVWHFMYFYIDGTIHQVKIVPFLFGLLVNSFVLASLFKISHSLWMCAMTHAWINVFSQTIVGENQCISLFLKIFIIVLAIMVSEKSKRIEK